VNTFFKLSAIDAAVIFTSLADMFTAPVV